jgi:DNA-binding MarR family transcriptional regulator
MSTHSSSPQVAVRPDAPSTSRGALLERVTTEWLTQLRAALTPLDLTPAQYHLLVAAAWLSARHSAVRQSDISGLANADPVMTSEVLRTLESRGLISRASHPTDRRAKAITVSEAGGALADRAMRLVEATETRFFEKGTADFGALAKALKKGGRGDSTS